MSSLALVPFGTSPLVAETDKGVGLIGSTPFLATQHGLTVEEVLKHRDTMKLVLNKKTQKMGKPSLAAACRELLKAKGVTDDQIKVTYKAYDQGRTQVHQDMRAHNAVLASHPDVRVTMRATKNKKTGAITRWHTTYAPANEGLSKKQEIARLQAEIKRLTKLALGGKTIQATVVSNEPADPQEVAAPFSTE